MRIVPLFVFAGAAVLAATIGSVSVAAAPQPNATAITFETMSCGSMTQSWTMNAQGEATLTERPEGGGRNAPLQTRTFKVAPADFERLRTLMAPAEKFIKKGLACRTEMTDLPYGAFKW